MRGLALSLIEHEKIQTTEAKASELRSFIEKIVTQSKTDTVTARRAIAKRLGEPKDGVLAKLFKELAPKYATRNGGYTRIIKTGETRAGRREACIEFV